MKFTAWMKIKEQMGIAQAGQSVLGAIGKVQGQGQGKDPTISKFVKDAVSDKTVDPKRIAGQAAAAAAKLRINAAKSADSGDNAGAFKNAIDAAKMNQIAASIK